MDYELPPLLLNKHYDRPAVFQPENLLREARRQKDLSTEKVPEICLLDPDGDVVSHLLAVGQAQRNLFWACYHTLLYDFECGGIPMGIIGNAVGGPFAVLLAEQLFASGCRLLISVTSAGQLVPIRRPPYFVLIDKALRDEGTSYHYLPPDKYSHLDPALLDLAEQALTGTNLPIVRGAAWTTDAPYRETEEAIAYGRNEGILAAEMESASLYAFAQARRHPVICFAHVTNQMATVEEDFEKGEQDGSRATLMLVETISRNWHAHQMSVQPLKGG